MGFFDAYDLTTDTDLIRVLNRLYASEIIAAEQYDNHGVAVQGIFSTELQAVFFEHAEDERKHATKLRDHIMVLGGLLDNRLLEMVLVNPTSGPDKDVRPGNADDAYGMLAIDLVGEADAVALYTEVALKVRDTWPLTFSLISEILADEYEHRHELTNLLAKG